MALTRQRKEQLVAEVREEFSAALSIAVVDSSGTDVTAMTEFRRRARQAGVRAQVVPNRLMRLAVQGTDHEPLQELASGPSLFVWSSEELSAPARVLKESAKDWETLKVKGLSLGRGCLGPKELAKIASLPSREEALAQLAGLLKAVPTRLATSLNAIPRKAATAVAAVRDQKSQAGA